ncbi:hypothetical protein CerSpe_215470 [Prunus speciosa]
MTFQLAFITSSTPGSHQIISMVELAKLISQHQPNLPLSLVITSSAHLPYDPQIPTYFYFTSCSSALALFLYLPTIHNQTPKSFRDLSRLRAFRPSSVVQGLVCSFRVVLNLQFSIWEFVQGGLFHSRHLKNSPPSDSISTSTDPNP